MSDYYDVQIEYVDGNHELIGMVSRHKIDGGVLHLFQLNNTVTREEDHLGSYNLAVIRKWKVHPR